MRRLLGLLAAFALLAATFPATVAAAPGRASGSRTTMFCEVTSSAGPVSILAEVEGTQPFVSVVIWGPDESPLTISNQADASFDGANLTGRFDLVDFNSGEPVGSADLMIAFTPDGPVQDFDSRDIRHGNQWIRLVQTIQFLDGSGSLVLSLGGASHTIDLDPCTASILAESIFATNPNAWLTDIDQVLVSCEWVTERGSVSLLAIADEVDTVSQVVVIQGDRAFVGVTAPTLSATGFEAVYDVSDVNSGEPAGGVTASALLSPSGERITENQWDGPWRLRETGERLSVDGTLTIDVLGASTRLVMDDSVCHAGDVQVQLMEKNAQD